MRTRTKIICTIGPSVNTLEKVLELIDAGMNAARINFSHGSYEEHAKTIALIKEARAMRGVPLALILDTKGPEIRLGEIEEGGIEVKAKDQLLLTSEMIIGNKEKIFVHPPQILSDIPVGATVLIDDGYIQSQVISRQNTGVVLEILNDGFIKTGKKVSVPGVNVSLPAMTQQDIKDIAFGCEQDIDIIAASFIRSADHVLQIKELLAKLGKPEILVYAKIENSLGVDNFDQIVQVSDGIMVARGDLGVELPITHVPSLQKMMIKKSCQALKPVATATQMLESMIQNPRPTRAEVSDVANAIYDSSSSIMLSGETAAGKYPIQSVVMMKDIATQTESHFCYRDFFTVASREDYHDVSSSVALATVRTAYSAGAKAIFAITSSGATARLLSSFRPEMPIIALSDNFKAYHQMAMVWGVIPVPPELAKNALEAIHIISNFAQKHALVELGDLVVVTAGTPFGIKGTTNSLLVQSIGDVLVRGATGVGDRVHGKIAILHSLEGADPAKFINSILLISRCNDSYTPYIKQALGVVLQNHPNDSKSEKFAMKIAKLLHKPLIVRADNALHFLQEGQLVTMDPERRIVFIGDVPAASI